MDLRARRVSEIMQTEVATLAPDEYLDLADDVMRLGRVRHLPVVDDVHLVGLVSNRDLLAASLTRALEFDPLARRAFMRNIAVSEIMSRDVLAIGPDANLWEAAALMVKHKIGCLPVVEEGDVLVGLLTETDLLNVAFLVEDPRAPVKVTAPSRAGPSAARALRGEIRESYERIGEML